MYKDFGSETHTSADDKRTVQIYRETRWAKDRLPIRAAFTHERGRRRGPTSTKRYAIRFATMAEARVYAKSFVK